MYNLIPISDFSLALNSIIDTKIPNNLIIYLIIKPSHAFCL